LVAGGYAIGLGIGVYLYTHGEASIGAAYLIVMYIGMLASPLQNIREQAQDLQQASASIQRIQELFGLQPQVKEPEVVAPNLAIQQSKPGPVSVEFQDVCFGYEGNGSVIKGVSFHLAPGKVLGVLGRTGSGKTTLTRLLFRLYDPDEGAVFLAGTDLRQLPLREIRRRIGMVTQDVQLFQASIRDNLTFFDDHISDERLHQALHTLGLGERLSALPGGLDAPLAAGGAGLSAGEAQLLAFGRVFLKDPGLVILDEASSRLDPVTERLMEHAIDELFRGRTGIVIAHRLETIQHVDEILILENGCVVEHGSRQKLAADPGSRFSQLLKTGIQEALA
jgi:ABC-type multidrug transport system fused ATPase/permease subunit